MTNTDRKACMCKGSWDTQNPSPLGKPLTHSLSNQRCVQLQMGWLIGLHPLSLVHLSTQVHDGSCQHVCSSSLSQGPCSIANEDEKHLLQGFSADHLHRSHLMQHLFCHNVILAPAKRGLLYPTKDYKLPRCLLNIFSLENPAL